MKDSQMKIKKEEFTSILPEAPCANHCELASQLE